MNDNIYKLRVDARQMICPMPLLKLKQALNQVNDGEVVSLLATDPTSKRDIVAYATLAHHQVSCEEEDGDITFMVIKNIGLNKSYDK